MRIAELVEIGRIAFRDIERPVAGPGEVVVRTRAVGLCGTDLKAYLRGHPYFKPPCVLGHEFTGTVVEIGEGIETFKLGDPVVAAPYIECGKCVHCLKGLGELCRHKAFIEGALQEYILIPRAIVERGTFHLSDHIGFAAGTLAEPLACAMNGVEKAAVGKDETVLVIGGGPMGGLLAMLAKSISPQILVAEISPARLIALQSLGFPTIDPSKESIPDRMEEQFGEPCADNVLIAVGAGSVAEEALAWTAPGGTALLFGGLPKGETMTIDPYAVHYREVSIAGSFGYRTDHFHAAVEWIEQHPEEAASLITNTVSFEHLESGFELARAAEGLKVVVVFGEDDEG
ncbi:alcohol dehydrogenase catalytic domain-containing protein [Candidatus Bipolaricaulota bacterium]